MPTEPRAGQPAEPQDLVDLPHLSDTAMVNELRGSLIDVTAPDPSVETILHAVIDDPALVALPVTMLVDWVRVYDSTVAQR